MIDQQDVDTICPLSSQERPGKLLSADGTRKTLRTFSHLSDPAVSSLGFFFSGPSHAAERGIALDGATDAESSLVLPPERDPCYASGMARKWLDDCHDLRVLVGIGKETVQVETGLDPVKPSIVDPLPYPGNSRACLAEEDISLEEGFAISQTFCVTGLCSLSVQSLATQACPSDSTCSDLFSTPPLTPDTLDDAIIPALSIADFLQDCKATHEDAKTAVTDTSCVLENTFHAAGKNECRCDVPSLREIPEGKKPDRSISHEETVETELAPNGDEIDDWYGLEYTLELSLKEHRRSDMQSPSAGEHSKSRESWAALRKGRIDPFFEDEDYYQWKNWHRYLDRWDELRRHKKGLAFKAYAKDLAWLYAEEMMTRDVMYWQKEVYGAVGEDVKERLATLVDKRPDPYQPPHKHGLAWYLKRSRSASCLRELRYLDTNTAESGPSASICAEEHVCLLDD